MATWGIYLRNRQIESGNRDTRPELGYRALAQTRERFYGAGEPTNEREKPIVHHLQHSPSLSVIVPAFNEATVIQQTLAHLTATIEAAIEDFEVVVVDDGSSDETADRVASMAQQDARIRLETYQPNRGKGYAIRRGFACTTGTTIAFYDADLDIPARYILQLIQLMELGNYDGAVGSKSHPDSDVALSPLRRVLSRAARLLVRALFRISIRDTQVGVKVFRRETLDAVIDRLRIDRFAFDLELLATSHALGFRVAEGPVTITPTRTPSKVGLKATVEALKDSLGVFYRVRIKSTSSPHLKAKQL